MSFNEPVTFAEVRVCDILVLPRPPYRPMIVIEITGPPDTALGMIRLGPYPPHDRHGPGYSFRQERYLTGDEFEGMGYMRYDEDV